MTSGLLSIGTSRLQLIPAGEAWLAALVAGPGSFTMLSDLRVADGFDDFPGTLRFSLDRVRRAPARELGWWAPLLFVEREENLVIGMGGYKGPPIGGSVEVGYVVAPSHRGLGFATEALAGLVAAAFKQRRVERVIAHTIPSPGPSPRVLEKCGFARKGDGLDPHHGIVWRWELPRPATSRALPASRPGSPRVQRQ